MNRIARIRQELSAQELDALCLRATSNTAYATGFDGVFDEEQAHALLITPEYAVLHTDSRYAGACRTASDGEIAIDDALGPNGRPLTHARWLAEQNLTGAVGIEDSITLAEYRKLQQAWDDVGSKAHIVETTGIVSTLRRVKDAFEIERLRAAQAITDDAFAYIVDAIRPGMTEREVQLELDNYMRAHGADALAFPSIVATGPNGANPHAQPTETLLEAGQCVVMDFGAKRAGYCSDMTRMVFIGQPDTRLQQAYDTLREANEQVEAMLKPGVTGTQAHQHALDVLEEGGFGGLMGHGLGHGVGMDIHEDPVLSPRNTEPLQAGNVVTVEPGIYVDGEFGMRLEDFGVITDEGFDVFTRSSHRMVII